MRSGQRAFDLKVLPFRTTDGKRVGWISAASSILCRSICVRGSSDNVVMASLQPDCGLLPRSDMTAYISPSPFSSIPFRNKAIQIRPNTCRALKRSREARLPGRYHDFRAKDDSPAPTAVPEWFQAARSGDIAQMTRLIRSGAVTTALIQDKETRQTALHAAAAESDAATVRALFELARGVGGARQDFAHRTNEAVQLLNVTDANGNTPLHFAAGRSDEGSITVVKALLSLGGDPAAPNENGETPGDVAERRGRKDILELLSQR